MSPKKKKATQTDLTKSETPSDELIGTPSDELMPMPQQNPVAPTYAMTWENGAPRANVVQPVFDKNNASNVLADLSKQHLNFPYNGDDERYFGMTKGEAMIAQWIDDASSGDADARREVMDRIMGKPQQNIKSVSVKATLGDYLDTLDTSEEDVIDI